MLTGFYKIGDAVFDRRLPHFLPYSYLRRYRLRRTIRGSRHYGRVYLALTFDVEAPFSSSSYKMRENWERPLDGFLSSLHRGILGPEKVTTLFIQGNLVKDHEKLFKRLSSVGHVLGLHGYDHELWGRPKWFLSDKPLSSSEKKRLLQESLECFERSGLERPITFRAPNLIADSSTLGLLQEFGFLVDSSTSSYEGRLPLPVFMDNNFCRIPVSADPLFKLRVKKGVVHSFYTLFALESFLNLSDESIITLINNICSLQTSFGLPNHLVFSGHSWEFTDWGLKKNPFTYCSSGNWRLLKNKLLSIENKMKVEYVTMTVLYKILKNEFDK